MFLCNVLMDKEIIRKDINTKLHLYFKCMPIISVVILISEDYFKFDTVSRSTNEVIRIILLL